MRLTIMRSSFGSRNTTARLATSAAAIAPPSHHHRRRDRSVVIESAASSAQVAIPEPRNNRRHTTEAIPSRRLLEIADPDGMAAHFIDGQKANLVGRIVADEYRRTPGELALLHEHLDGASLVESAWHE